MSKKAKIIIIIIAILFIAGMAVFGYFMTREDPNKELEVEPLSSPMIMTTPEPTVGFNDPLNTPSIVEPENIPTSTPTITPNTEGFVPPEYITEEEFNELPPEEQDAYLFYWDEEVSYDDACAIELEILSHVNDLKYGLGVSTSVEKDGYTYALIGLTSGRIARLFPEQKTCYVLCSAYAFNDFAAGDTYDHTTKSLWRRVDFNFTNQDGLESIPYSEVKDKMGNISSADMCSKYISKEPLEAYNKFINNFKTNFNYSISNITDMFTTIDVLDFHNGSIIVLTEQRFQDPVICASFDNGETWHTTAMTMEQYIDLYNSINVTEVPRWSLEDQNPEPTWSFTPHHMDDE